MGIDPADITERGKLLADRYIGRGGQNPLELVAAKGITPRGKRIVRPELLTALGPKHKLIIDRMVFGLDRPHAAFPSLLPGQPLSADQIADIYNLKRRYVRRLLDQTIFVAALNQAVNALRNGAKPTAVRKMIDLIGHVGEGKAADAKVALDAAKAVLGEKDGGLTVNVGVQVGVNNVNVQPGYVIDLGERPKPITINASP